MRTGIGLRWFLFGVKELTIFASITSSLLKEFADWRMIEIAFLTFSAFALQIKGAYFAILFATRGGSSNLFPVGGRSGPAIAGRTIVSSPSWRTISCSRSPWAGGTTLVLPFVFSFALALVSGSRSSSTRTLLGWVVVKRALVSILAVPGLNPIVTVRLIRL